MKALQIRDKIKYGLAIAYVVSGDDNVLKDYVVKSICATMPKDEREFSISTFEGVVGISEIINTAQMISFFEDSRRIVIVKNYVKELKAKDEEKLLEYVDNPNENCTLIFVDCGKTFKAIADFCVFVDCNKASSVELTDFVKKMCEPKGYKIEDKAVKEILNVTNSDMGKIIQETKKVMAFTEDTKNITLDDVKEIMSINAENKVYDLTDALQAGKNDEALDLLDKMLKRGEKPAALLGLITAAYRRLFWVANSNASDDEMCKVLGIPPYGLTRTKQTIRENKARRRGYIPYLKKMLDLLYDLEYRFKSGAISEDTALRIAITHLLG